MTKYNSDEARDRAIAVELTARAETSVITPGICRELAKQFELTPRSVMARAARLELPIELSDASESDEDEDDDRDLDDRPRFTPSTVLTDRHPDTHYGVLQGPANVVGGCASLWGWVIVILIVAVVVALFTGQLN